MADRRERSEPGRVLKITSLTNPLVKEIRGLAQAKNRRASGRFLAEGLKLAKDALDADWTIRHLIHAAKVADDPNVAAIAAAARTRGADIVIVNDAVLSKITRRDNPQTVIGVFDQQTVRLPAPQTQSEKAVWIALERIRDPGNLGTIVRTADAVGAAGVILVGDTVDPFSIEAVRATMGSIFHVPIARTKVETLIALAANWPGSVVGTHLNTTTDYRVADYGGPVLLAMGAEQSGLTPELAQACKTLVKIPMAGQADSLNLAVATGVMLFEICKPRLTLHG